MIWWICHCDNGDTMTMINTDDDYDADDVDEDDNDCDADDCDDDYDDDK